MLIRQNVPRQSKQHKRIQLSEVEKTKHPDECLFPSRRIADSAGSLDELHAVSSGKTIKIRFLVPVRVSSTRAFENSSILPFGYRLSLFPHPAWDVATITSAGLVLLLNDHSSSMLDVCGSSRPKCL